MRAINASVAQWQRYDYLNVSHAMMSSSTIAGAQIQKSKMVTSAISSMFPSSHTNTNAYL
jgi:hypothetical protein